MSIEDLYKYYELLDQAKEKISEHESEYLAIVGAVKGSSQEKRLASQFVAKFFKHFPNHSEQALNAICNLCEDEDSAIRKQAIKDLPTLCKEAPSSLQRVSSMLTRLLQTDDVTEQNLVNMSLMSVLKQDAKETLTGIFSQITEGSETVRDRALKFLINKIKLLPEVTKDVENLIVVESLKVLEDATGSEFVLFMKLLPILKVMHTVQGRQHLVEIVTVQADLDIPFNVNDPEAVDRLVQCARQVLPLLSKNVHSDKFLAVLSDQVLPNLGQLQQQQQQQVSADGAGDKANNGDNGDAAAHSASTASSSSDITPLDVLKLLAEMSVFAGDIKQLQTGLRNVFNATLEYMPVPPAPAEEGAEAKAEPRLEFSHVECLLYALHQLARHKPDFLTDNEEQLKDFRARLQYFAHRTQQYIKDIKVNLANRKPGDKSEEHQVKVLALKVTNNIATLIKDLFHTPPSYKVVVTPSWKSPVAVDAIPPLITPASATGTKRPSIEAPLGSKTEVKRYAPPTGKFSERTGGYRGREGRGYGRQGYWT